MVEVADAGAAMNTLHLVAVDVFGSQNTRIPKSWPVGGMVKMPGALGTIVVLSGGESTPFTIAMTLTGPGVTPKGTCALTNVFTAPNGPTGATSLIGA